jgi:hypothetical protein
MERSCEDMPRNEEKKQTNSQYRQLSSLIRDCRYEDNDVDRQIELLQEINLRLPKSIRVRLPSLITNDYVAKALDIIEERVASISL